MMSPQPLPDVESSQERIESAFIRLIDIMQSLRDPEHGCPWDVQQDHQSIARYTLEEAYEVVEAIEHNQMGDLCDELGDLLLQVVFHAQMSAERGDFDIAAVATRISEKMVRRHPHVFGEEKVEDEAHVHANWEEIKAQERLAKQSGDDSVLADVPHALPGLSRAVKLQKRAAKVGFDWPEIAPVYAKVEEELAEVKACATDEQRQEEIGDLLFAVTNLARHYSIDPETAIRHANRKFETRFRAIEDALKHQGKDMSQSSLEEMEVLWQQAKVKS